MAQGQNQASRQLATERADELLERMGHTAGIFASLIGDRLARVAVSAYEEAEDMWAEAHHIRQQYVFVREEKPEPESIEVTATARRQANELGVNLEEVQGTGKGGKVTTL